MLEDAHIAGFGLQHFTVELQQADEVHAAQDEQADDDQYRAQGIRWRHQHNKHDDRPHQRADRDRQLEKSKVERPFLRSNRRCTAR